MVGREAEIAFSHQCLDRARLGKRQVVFVTGEAGLGKTTLVEALVQEVGLAEAMWIGRGQCIEPYGSGEAYLPVLEALEQMCRSPRGQILIDSLARQAPTWLIQMPWLLSSDAIAGLQPRTTGATQERMLREMARALEVLSAEKTLLLVLEDLHWSDYATLDLLAMLARRQEAAKLLVLGTYRPEEVMGQRHPLYAMTHELHIHGHCETLPLTFLSEAAVAVYLTARLGETPNLKAWTRFIHRRTEGNPLFMVTVVDEVVAQDGLGKHRVPESLRQLLEQRLDWLSPDEQRLIEVGSMAGAEFAVAAVAFALAVEIDQIEAGCEGLTRRGQWLQARGTETWPDGTVSGRYGFIHALYQEVAYHRVAPARRLRYHRHIGERLETGYGARAQERAAELAVHFERGQVYEKAVQYREQAAENAIRRAAYREAITHLTNGLTLAETLPDVVEHTQSKLHLLILLALAYTASKGQAVPEVEQTYVQARALCEHVHDDYRLFRVLIGLARCYGVRSEYQKGEEISDVLLQVAQRTQDPRLLLEAHMFRANFTLFAGAYRETRHNCEQALANYDRHDHHFYVAQSTIDPGVNILSRLSWALWCLGYPEQALTRNREMLTLARELGHVHSLAMFSNFAALTHQLCGEAQAVEALTHDAMRLSTEHGFHQLHVTASLMQGWFLASHCQQASGITQMQQGLAEYTTTGIVLYRLWYLTLLADVYRQHQQSCAGLATLAEATTISRPFFEPELSRLQGELLLMQSWDNQAEAAACFAHALDLARQQQARSWELRTATSLAHLWQSQDKRHDAYDLLASVYGWFTEGFDTADLRKAKALLEELV